MTEYHVWILHFVQIADKPSFEGLRSQESLHHANECSALLIGDTVKVDKYLNVGFIIESTVDQRMGSIRVSVRHHCQLQGVILLRSVIVEFWVSELRGQKCIVGSKALIEPHVAPPLTGHQVTKPLMC